MTFPERLNVTATINGVDVTSYVRPGTLNIANVLTQQVDTLSAILERSKALSLSDWQEVVVLDGVTRIFGGFLQDTDGHDGDNIDVDTNLAASDYSIRFEKVIVKEEFENKTDAYILNYLFTKYMPGEGFDATTFVSTIKTHPRIRFNRKTLSDCIGRLVKLAKADWYVDYDKKLHFFYRGTADMDAPFVLSDNPDMVSSFPYYDFVYTQDGSGVVNRVEVVGGNYRSDDTTFYLAGTGQDNRIILPFKLHAPTGQTSIQVWRNDGTQVSPVWTPLTVLVGYVDDLTAASEVSYYFQEKVLEQQANWPALTNAVKVTAKYEVPLRTRVQDQSSYKHYGMYFDDVIVDNSITDKAVARMAGLAKLAESATAKTAITLKLNQPGLRSGQIVNVINSLRSLNSSYVVQKVACKTNINGKAYYTVSLGTYNPGLVDLMLKLARSTKSDIAWSDEEVLDEVLQMSESITFTESTSVANTTGPYYFSNDPAQAFIWGFGAFQT